jgi:calcium-dependent protein kinase
LGEGAYGKVSLVTHNRSGIVRAMKEIAKTGVREDKATKMLEEVSILKSLDHPNVVKLFELYQDDKNYYLITE